MNNESISDKVKAENYDDLMKANSEIIQNNISITKIHQENKQLKNKLIKIRKWYDARSPYPDVVNIHELKQLLNGDP